MLPSADFAAAQGWCFLEKSQLDQSALQSSSLSAIKINLTVIQGALQRNSIFIELFPETNCIECIYYWLPLHGHQIWLLKDRQIEYKFKSKLIYYRADHNGKPGCQAGFI